MHKSLSWKIVNTNNKTKKGQTMTEPERKKDGQLLIPFQKQLQLAIQFKEKQK